LTPLEQTKEDILNEINSPKGSRKILEWLYAGHISEKEAFSLLKQIGKLPVNNPSEENRSSQTLRIRVTHIDTGHVQADYNVPVHLVDIGCQMGARFVPDVDGLNINQVLELVNDSTGGKIAEVVDNAKQERVEVILE